MNLEVKQYNSEDFNYNNKTLEQFLPLFSAYAQIVSNGKEGNNLTVEDLVKNMPNENDKKYAEQSFIHQMLDHIADDSKVFVLNRDNKPVSFAIFSNKNKNDKKYILELVYTIEKEQGRGFAKYLLLESFKELKKDALSVLAHVEEGNYASLELNKSLGTLFFEQIDTKGSIDIEHIINDELANEIRRRKALKQQETEKEI